MRRVEDRLEMMPVRVDDEGRMVMRTIVGAQARPAIVLAAMSERGRMEPGDALTIRSSESQVEPGSGRTLALRAKT